MHSYIPRGKISSYIAYLNHVIPKGNPPKPGEIIFCNRENQIPLRLNGTEIQEIITFEGLQYLIREEASTAKPEYKAENVHSIVQNWQYIGILSSIKPLSSTNSKPIIFNNSNKLIFEVDCILDGNAQIKNYFGNEMLNFGKEQLDIRLSLFEFKYNRGTQILHPYQRNIVHTIRDDVTLPQYVIYLSGEIESHLEKLWVKRDYRTLDISLGTLILPDDKHTKNIFKIQKIKGRNTEFLTKYVDKCKRMPCENALNFNIILNFKSNEF